MPTLNIPFSHQISIVLSQRCLAKPICTISPSFWLLVILLRYHRMYSSWTNAPWYHKFILKKNLHIDMSQTELIVRYIKSTPKAATTIENILFCRVNTCFVSCKTHIHHKMEPDVCDSTWRLKCFWDFNLADKYLYNHLGTFTTNTGQ